MFRSYNKKILLLYIILVVFGLLNLYDLNQWSDTSFTETRFFKQCLWFGVSLGVFLFIHFIEIDLIYLFAYQLFFLSLALVFFTLLKAKAVGGHKAWLSVGGFTLQSGEFLKLTCALTVAKLLSRTKHLSSDIKTSILTFLVIGISAASILLQGDLGSAMVFAAFIIPLYICNVSIIFIIHCVIFVFLFALSLIFPFKFLLACIVVMCLLLLLFYRRYFKSIFLLGLDIGSLTFLSDYLMNHALRQYHKDRIKVLFDSSIDTLGLSWNILQSKIAIGNGGFFGRGFGIGTQTKYNFIPAQQTDFIFCTIAEEYGFIGSFLYALTFFFLIIELINVAEKQNIHFNKIFIYSVAAILFFHFAVNIAMTCGLFPIVGIPLPFMSYGGSSLIVFSTMIFISLKLDVKNNNIY